MTPEQQKEYRQWLSRGASPAAACTQLGIELEVVATTLAQDDAFRRSVELVHELLSQNVAAALYRAAIEGSVSAQTFYLKNHPPPGWRPAEENSIPTAFEDLTDDQLIARFRQEAPALLARLASGDSSSTGTASSGSVSRSPADSE